MSHYCRNGIKSNRPLLGLQLVHLLDFGIKSYQCKFALFIFEQELVLIKFTNLVRNEWNGKMEVIKSVNDLPEWFKNKKYERNLDAVDWYREIRKREWAGMAIQRFFEFSKKPGATINNNHIQEMFECCIEPMKKDWVIYYLSEVGQPVEDMQKATVMYMAAALADTSGQWALTSFIELVQMYKRDRESGRLIFTGEYEELLAGFMEAFFDEDGPVKDLGHAAVDFIIEQGDPFLSYGRALEGYPVVVDLQFDDESILLYMKRWLAKRREIEGEKARRPFLQNDFDDWVYYRIREVHDLDLWSKVYGVKILDKVIAAALWPNSSDEVSPIDILRTTSRKKVKEVFRWEVCRRLYSQLTLERGENFLDQ